MAKKTINKIICIVIIMAILGISILPSFSYANVKDVARTGLTNSLSGVTQFVFFVLKLLVLVPGLVAQGIMSMIATSYNTQSSTAFLTLDNILFNQLTLTDINIFSNSAFLIGPGGNIVIDQLQSNNGLLGIRESIATWYYAFRNLAVVVSLLMLIYTGIRMAITSIAEQKAKYKTTLTNWFVGFGLIFLLQYIIIIVIFINNKLIEILAKTNISPDNGNYSNIMNELLKQSWLIDITNSSTSAIMYTLLVITTFFMLITFIKRLVTVSYLVLISPLITITYVLDKEGDNKSQILNTWLKEFCFNVFIQIAYAITYLIFTKTAIDMFMDKGVEFGSMFLAVLSVYAMFLAIKIIKQIFGFGKARSLVSELTMGAMISKTWSGAKNTTKTVINKTKEHKNKQQSLQGANLPMYTSTGEETDDVIKKLEKQKHNENMERKIEEKSNKRASRNTQRKRRILKNVKFKNVARIYRSISGIDTLTNMYQNIKNDIKDKIDDSKGKTVKVEGKDLLDYMFKDYATSNNVQTGEEFERHMDRIRRSNFVGITSEEAILLTWLKKAEEEVGARKVQNIITNFKDTNW